MAQIDDPDEIDRAAAALAAAVNSIGSQEQRLRTLMSTLPLRSTDPGGRTNNEFRAAAEQIRKARETFEDISKRMRRVAQELRNQRIR